MIRLQYLEPGAQQKSKVCKESYTVSDTFLISIYIQCLSLFQVVTTASEHDVITVEAAVSCGYTSKLNLTFYYLEMYLLAIANVKK